jgi:hypothetical protein
MIEITELRAQRVALEVRSEALIASVLDGMPSDEIAAIEREHQDVIASVITNRLEIGRHEQASPAERSELAYVSGRGSDEARAKTITELSTTARLADFGILHIALGTTVEDFRTALLDRLVERDERAPIDGNFRVEVGEEHSEKRASAVENALLHRSDPDAFPLTAAGREMRGLDLLDMARETLQAGGMNTRGMTREEIAAEALSKRSGYHGTSDFPTILGNIGNATLRRAYDAAPQTFRPFVREVTVPDFKVVSRVQLGEAPSLEKVNEHGEYKRGTLGEGSESYRIYSFGKIIGLTRQALINDQFHAFSRLPAAFGLQAAELESDLVWAQLLGNPLMGDGTALCALSRKNLATSLTALTSPSAVAALSAGTTAMAKMRGLDGKTTLNIKPSFLVTGEEGRPAAEVIVEQELSPISPSMAVPRRVRDLKLIVEPRVDNGINRPDMGIAIAGAPEAWWLAVEPGWLDTIELAYLEGEKHLRLEARTDFNTDGVEFRASIDVGSKAIDWRGFYKGM